MASEVINFVPGPEASAGKASGIANNLVTRKRIQRWTLADSGVGIQVVLYPDGSGVVDDLKGYDVYRSWVIEQMGLAGFILPIVPETKPAAAPAASGAVAGGAGKAGDKAAPVAAPAASGAKPATGGQAQPAAGPAQGGKKG